MKTTKHLADESRVNVWFFMFLVGVIILALTFVSLISTHVRDVFIQWLAGIIGGLCLVAVAVTGLLIYCAWESEHRKRISLESDNNAMRAIIQNEARKQGHL